MANIYEELNYSSMNYNDYLSDNFVGYEPADEPFDDLMRSLNRIARYLHTRAEKLWFAVMYEDMYLDDAYVKELFDGYYACHDGVDFVYDEKSNVLIFRNEQELNSTMPSLTKYGETYEESFGKFVEGLVDITDDFMTAREEWRKLGLGISFDDALEEWNRTSELADENGWYAKPVYSQRAWKDMVDMFSNK